MYGKNSRRIYSKNSRRFSIIVWEQFFHKNTNCYLFWLCRELFLKVSNLLKFPKSPKLKKLPNPGHLSSRLQRMERIRSSYESDHMKDKEKIPTVVVNWTLQSKREWQTVFQLYGVPSGDTGTALLVSTHYCRIENLCCAKFSLFWGSEHIWILITLLFWLFCYIFLYEINICTLKFSLVKNDWK